MSKVTQIKETAARGNKNPDLMYFLFLIFSISELFRWYSLVKETVTYRLT